MAKSRRYTNQQFIQAVKNSVSIAEVARSLGLACKGGNYRTIKKLIEELDLCTKHFSGQGWSKGKIIGPQKDIQEYLSNNVYIRSNALKSRLLSENLKEHRCEKCHLSLWQDSPIPIELHHIDGNYENNNLSNLQILCPNCHALTDNYRGKNQNRSKKEQVDKQLIFNIMKPKSRQPSLFETSISKCIDCGKEVYRKSTRCKSCAAIYQHGPVSKRPPYTILIISYCKNKCNMTITGREYGVSDNAVRKWFKFYKKKKVAQAGHEPALARF